MSGQDLRTLAQRFDQPIMAPFSVLGNSLVIAVILTNKLLRSSTNLFLLNLSVADLLVLLTSTPTSLVEIVHKNDAWLMGRVSSSRSTTSNKILHAGNEVSQDQY